MNFTLALQSDARGPGPWPRRAAMLSALFAVPLLLFGGSVTSLGAGMAVDGWLIAEGHFLLFFPVQEWFRDTATFVEHTHRLFGVLVGLSAMTCAGLAWLREERLVARLGATLALLAVCAQGALGGLRVLANDSDLAFLHGAFAQLVFAGLCLNAVLFSHGWQSASARKPASVELLALRRSALAAFGLVYAQVVLGAWYRHGLRPIPVEGSALRLLLHGLGALLTLVALAQVARRGAGLRRRDSGVPSGLSQALRILPGLLVAQLVLGALAWAGFRPGRIGPAEWLLSLLHVLGGALLLTAIAVITLWAWRLTRDTAPADGAREVG